MNIENQLSPTWYKEIWSMNLLDMTWVGDTEKEVDFLIDVMELSGSERILDLACGFGRHANLLAGRGFSVVGVDITAEYIQEAERIAADEGLCTRFICADLRDVVLDEKFDVVINMADGAIGYLEDDYENLKIFDLVASSLKRGGKHFMHIHNAEYAELHFPVRNWQITGSSLALPELHWDKESRRMLYGGWALRFGEIMEKPDNNRLGIHSSIRLYSLKEIEETFTTRKMVVKRTFGKYDKTVPSSHWDYDLLVYSQKLQ